MLKKPCIIITRPIADAQETAKLLENHGFDYFIEPIINIETITNALPDLAEQITSNNAIIITSRNAIKALAPSLFYTNTKLITLGKATYTFAKEQGFTNVEYAGEDVKELIRHIKAHYCGQPLIYASGEIITKELTQENCGAAITRICVYKTIATQEFSTEFKKKLKHGSFNAVIFLSTKTAEIFCHLLEKEGLETHIETLYAFCLSKNIAKNISSYGFKATMYPKNYDIKAIIKLLAKFQF